MPINHVYVDPSVGGPGSGTIGDPWDDMQAALDGITDGGAGNQINLKAGTAEVLAAALTWGSYSPVNSADNPLIIRGYTSVANDGGIGEIDGNNAVANLFSQTSDPQYVIFVDLKMHNTTAAVVQPNTNNQFIRCEIYNGGSTATLAITTSTHMIGCNIHTGTSGAIGVSGSGGQNNFLFNRITDHDDKAIDSAGSNQFFLGNLIHDISSHGIEMQDYGFAVGNTLVGDSTAGQFGLKHGNSAGELSVWINNIIKDFGSSGSGGAADVIAGSNLMVVGYNNLNGNDSDTYANELIFGLDLTGNDTTTDPTFTNAAGDDYSVGTNAQADGYPTSFPGTSTNTFVDVGAAQRQEAGATAVEVHNTLVTAPWVAESYR